jgi:hypothetical protein
VRDLRELDDAENQLWADAIQTYEDLTQELAGAIVTERVEMLRRVIRMAIQVKTETPSPKDWMAEAMKRSKGGMHPRDLELALMLVTTAPKSREEP